MQLIRYHSLVAKEDFLPQDLKINATANDGAIIAVHHKQYHIEDIPFHSESIKMKPNRMQILKDFSEL